MEQGGRRGEREREREREQDNAITTDDPLPNKSLYITLLVYVRMYMYMCGDGSILYACVAYSASVGMGWTHPSTGGGCGQRRLEAVHVEHQRTKVT